MRATVFYAVMQIVLVVLWMFLVGYALTLPDHVCDPRVMACE